MEDHVTPPGEDEVRESADGETSIEERASDPSLEFRRQRAKDLEGAPEIRRFQAGDVEIRELSDSTLRFTGYASVTERSYEVGGFEETIARGAFKRTLSENPDVVLLLNHDGLPLARTKSGTLTLTEDARGLRVDADLNPEDPDVQRVRPKLERGDVDEMSFAFRVTSDKWDADYTKRRVDGLTINKGDVSIVTYGANDASTGGIAGMLRSADEALVEVRAGKTLSAKTRSELQDAYDKLGALLSESEGKEDPEPEPERAAERDQEERKVIPLPDYAKRQRERLAVLKGGHHR